MPAGSLAGSRAAFATCEKIDAQVGAGHAERAVGEDDVLRRNFQKMRGELGALLDDGAPGLVKRRAADGNARASRRSAPPACGRCRP